MAPSNFLYFDHRQAPDERGYGSHVSSIENVYRYELPSSEESSGHILGAQGALWSELIPTEERMDYMAYPRVSALSETVWSHPGKKSITEFGTRLAHHIRRLDYLKVNYRFPGDIICTRLKGKIVLTSLLPDGIIHYTTDGSSPDISSPVVKEPLNTDIFPLIKAAAFFPDGRKGHTLTLRGASASPLRPETADIKGGMIIERLLKGRKNIGRWGNPNGSLSWRLRVEYPGTYIIDGDFAALQPAEMELKTEVRTFSFKINPTGRWNKPAETAIGKIKFPASGIYNIQLHVKNKKEYKGINLWEIRFKLQDNSPAESGQKEEKTPEKK
jgi:hypothetical protein